VIQTTNQTSANKDQIGIPRKYSSARGMEVGVEQSEGGMSLSHRLSLKPSKLQRFNLLNEAANMILVAGRQNRDFSRVGA
jgi:hypothetical protein